MKKFRIYLDTSVIGGVFDQEFTKWSKALFQKIIDDKIVVWLDEPFEGDGSEEILKDVLTEWLPTHEFIDLIDQSEIFDNIIEEVYQSLPDISIDNKNTLDEIIKKLNVAKTMMR